MRSKTQPREMASSGVLPQLEDESFSSETVEKELWEEGNRGGAASDEWISLLCWCIGSIAPITIPAAIAPMMIPAAKTGSVKKNVKIDEPPSQLCFRGS